MEQQTTCIMPIGVCHNSYYPFLNFKNVDTVRVVTPEYNTVTNLTTPPLYQVFFLSYVQTSDTIM